MANRLVRSKWWCKYHIVYIVFTTKYRRKNDYWGMWEDTGDMIWELCKQKGMENVEGKVMPGHTHLLPSIPPKYSVLQIMEYLKGKSSLIIFDRHTNLKYIFGI